MLTHFSLACEVTIRPCQREDLAPMEWFGRYRHYREVFRRNFERYEKGEIAMLVADVNSFPAGQVWVDFTKRRTDKIGILWALRVIEPLQRLGIGTRLMAAAEGLLKEKGLIIVELGVEKENLAAQKLYERRGYRVVDDLISSWHYTTPEGKQIEETAEEWVLHKSLL